MFAEDMPQRWAIYQVLLTNCASAPLFNNPIAVFSLEADARAMFDILIGAFPSLTYVLTSCEDGREGYSEVN